MDAFAAFEEALAHRLDHSGSLCAGNSLGQNLKILAKTSTTGGSSDGTSDRIRAIIEGCEAVIPIRNDLVHSRLHLISIDQVNHVCLINTANARSTLPEARIVSLSALQTLTKKMLEAARTLREA